MASKFDLASVSVSLTRWWERTWSSKSGRMAMGAVALVLVAFFWLGWRAHHPGNDAVKRQKKGGQADIVVPQLEPNETLPADAQLETTAGPTGNAKDGSWVLYQSTSDGISAAMPAVPQRQDNSLAMAENDLTADGYVYTSTDEKVTYVVTYQHYSQLPDGVSARDFFTATDEDNEDDGNTNVQWFEVNGSLVRETTGYDPETRMYLHSRATLLPEAIVGISAASREPISEEEFDYVARSLQVKQ